MLSLALEGLIYRGVHVLAGVVWLAMLLAHALVQLPALSDMGPTGRREALARLLPRVVFYTQWASALAWVSGAALMATLYYSPRAAPLAHAATSEFAGQSLLPSQWGLAVGACIAAVALYDAIARALGRHAGAALVLWGLGLIAYGTFLERSLHFSPRAIWIHLGAAMGSAMALNAWLHLGPCLGRLAAAARAGADADVGDLRRAAQRAGHNLAQALPLLVAMVAVHQENLLGFQPWQALFGGIFVTGWAVGFGLQRSALWLERP